MVIHYKGRKLCINSSYNLQKQNKNQPTKSNDEQMAMMQNAENAVTLPLRV
jgi:hypothetical protein